MDLGDESLVASLFKIAGGASKEVDVESSPSTAGPLAREEHASEKSGMRQRYSAKTFQRQVIESVGLPRSSKLTNDFPPR